MQLKCPVCGWEYNPRGYAAVYSPEKYVPHHEKDTSWCPGTEQPPKVVEAVKPEPPKDD